jgi:Arc/MetJ-type ribon-helix-helix transcriptional regulator
MASVKVTFTLDQQTVTRIKQTAARLGMPRSGVVREAVREYAARADRLTEAERLRRLAIWDELLSRPPTRPQHEVDREIEKIRRARRRGGRRTPLP